MAPEQLEGKEADARTDIFAFGAVVYEMATGKKAFEGKSPASVISAIMSADPQPISASQPLTPPLLDHIVKRCLAKDPEERWQTATDLMRELKWIAEAGSQTSVPAFVATAAPRSAAWRRTAALALALLLVGALAGTVVWLAMRAAPPRVARLTITPSSTAALAVSGIDRDLAISPDGTRLVYVGGNGQLFVRALDQLEATPLAGLGALRHPFFSPDGDWIGFFDGTTLKKVAISGGPAVTLCRLDGGPHGATWGADDTIIFATFNASTGLWRVSAAGGEPTRLTTPNRERGERDHLWPEVLPDGQGLLFTIVSTGPIENAQVAVLDLRTGTQKILVRGGSHAHYVPSGHLVYGVAGTLRAAAFDLERLEMVGSAIPVLQQVVTKPDGAADFDVARDGTLVYVPGGVQAVARTLVWVDRQGREDPITAPVRAYLYPRLSPDGRRIALDVRDQESDIWIWDLARETLTRFTFDPASDWYPVWTPDGGRIVFGSARTGPTNLFWQAADGTGAAERLTQSPNLQSPYVVSPDGTRVVFREEAPTTGQDLMVLVLERERPSTSSGRGPSTRSASSGSTVSGVETSTGSRQAQGVPSSSRDAGRGEPAEPRRASPLVQTTFNELNAEISPDGRWLAYQSNESGQDEIYVRPFPDVGSGRWQISTSGGTKPAWAHDGQELFYLAPTGTLMSVRIERGSSFTAATPTKLFAGRYYFGGGSIQGRTYDVSPDGRRFLMIKPGGGTQETATPTSLIVVLNWLEELKRLVPTR